jgi:hypothetical protein
VERYNIDFCYLNNFITDEKLNVILTPIKKQFYSWKELFCKNYVGGYFFAKRDIIEAILPVNENVSFEDWYIALKLAVKYGKVPVFRKPAYYYRRHRGSTTFNVNQRDKYLYLIERDLKLFRCLRDDEFFRNYRKYIEFRVFYFEFLLGKRKRNLKNTSRILFNASLTLREKIKALGFKIYLNWKYND